MANIILGPIERASECLPGRRHLLAISLVTLGIASLPSLGSMRLRRWPISLKSGVRYCDQPRSSFACVVGSVTDSATCFTARPVP